MEVLKTEFHEKLVGMNESITVEQLIEANCLQAFEALEVIPSQGNESCAIRTALGWCVIGPVDMKDSKKVSCNRLAVTETSSGDTAKHNFVVEDESLEVGIQEMLMKLCMQDFAEPKTKQVEICDALQEV